MPNWWDASWNPVAGCAPASSGCRNCYASQLAATQQTGREIPIHVGTTNWINRRPVFNGGLTQLTPGNPGWVWPLTWKGAKRPILGEGQPSLIFTCDMSDLFHEDRPVSIIRRVVETIAISNHIGQLLTKRPDRMREYFDSLPIRRLGAPFTQARESPDRVTVCPPDDMPAADGHPSTAEIRRRAPAIGSSTPNSGPAPSGGRHGGSCQSRRFAIIRSGACGLAADR